MNPVLDNIYPLSSVRAEDSTKTNATAQRDAHIAITQAKPEITKTGESITGAIAYPKNLELLNTEDAVPLSSGCARTLIVSSAAHT